MDPLLEMHQTGLQSRSWSPAGREPSTRGLASVRAIELLLLYPIQLEDLGEKTRCHHEGPDSHAAVRSTPKEGHSHGAEKAGLHSASAGQGDLGGILSLEGRVLAGGRGGQGSLLGYKVTASPSSPSGVFLHVRIFQLLPLNPTPECVLVGAKPCPSLVLCGEGGCPWHCGVLSSISGLCLLDVGVQASPWVG